MLKSGSCDCAVNESCVQDQILLVSPDSQPIVGNRLHWEHTIWGSHPKWVVEPCLDRIEQAISPHIQQLWASRCSRMTTQDIDIEFLAEGAFNKTYTATRAPCWHRQSYIVRISLPVDAYYKTVSEVATIKYLRAHTSIPIPEVFSWDASDQNPIGFEWILMERVIGLPLQEVWYPEHKVGSVGWHIKERTVELLADAVAQMWRLRFPVGGSLYVADEVGVPGPVDVPGPADVSGLVDNYQTLPERIPVKVGREVSLEFFWEDHLHLTGIERGPFSSSRPWLESRLRFVMADAEKVMYHVQGIDKGEMKQAICMKEVAERLLHQLPNFIPMPLESTLPESFALCHADFSGHNILVDHNGTLVSIIDWECTNALPTWSACQVPDVIDSIDPRTEKPREEDYGDVALYLEDLESYELAKLRRLFLARMSDIEPS